MRTTAFWIGALDRALKSFAQALLLLWGADGAFNLLDVDLVTSLGVAGGAAVLSVLTSIVSAPLGGENTTSLLPGGR